MPQRFLFLSILILFFACQSDDEMTNPPENAFEVDCIRLLDPNGAAIGQYGDCTAGLGWGFQPLTSVEGMYFDELETLDPTNSTAWDYTEILAYPNPFTNGTFFVSPVANNPTDSTILNLALVDLAGEVVLSGSFWIQPFGSLALQVPPNVLPGQFLRLYYYFSHNQNEIGWQGYGDLVYCVEPFTGGDLVEECLE